jgi:hypothetical protein
MGLGGARYGALPKNISVPKLSAAAGLPAGGKQRPQRPVEGAGGALGLQVSREQV